MRPNILIADGEDILRQNLTRHAEPYGFNIIEARDRTNLLGLSKTNGPDIFVVGSFNNDPSDGLELAKMIRRRNFSAPIILIAKHSSEALAIAALRAGVSDYFKVPFSVEKLMESVNRNLYCFQTCAPLIQGHHPMIGDSESIQEIRTYIQQVAQTDSTVLVTGETGTGKGLAAELIHINSARQKEPFVCITCTALPESLLESELFGYERGAFTGAVAQKKGKLEMAGGGSAFLDEIGDLSLYAQAKVLRVIENKEIERLGGTGGILLDVRFITATHHEPEQLVIAGGFREDLYYRLNVARVHLPPLRERKEDIPLLVDHIIRELNQRFGRDVQGLTNDAMDRLIQYNWPGNIRELKNLLESTFIGLLSRKIDFADLPKRYRERLNELSEPDRSERDRILSALFATKWNKSKAAQKLNWSRMTLYRKMAKYKIHKTMGPKTTTTGETPPRPRI